MCKNEEKAGILLPEREVYYRVSDNTAKLAAALHRVDAVRLELKDSGLLPYQLGEAFDQLMLDLETAISTNIRTTLRNELKL